MAMPQTLFYASGVVLVGWHGGRNRMASSRGVSVGNAFPVDPFLGGRDFSGGWPIVLGAHRTVIAEHDEVASMVYGFVPLPRHAAL
jgi:hypothetical protein